MQYAYHETESFFHRLNPLSKCVAPIPLLIILSLDKDVWLPIIVLLMHISIILALCGVPLLRLLRIMAAFSPLFISFLLVYPLFTSQDARTDSALFFQIGTLHIGLAGALLGLTTALRVCALLLITVPFALTTEASDFIRALVQQWHVNYRFGYGAMVAYRFFPLLQSELHSIRAAHKVRGVSDQGGLWGQYQRARRYAIPLLVSAIRSAERVAIAMDARAFGAFPTRTYYHRLRFTRRDWLFITLYWLLHVSITIVLLRLGLLKLHLFS